MSWSLTYNGAARTFGEWDFTDPVMRLASQRAGTFSVRLPTNTGLDQPPPIPYGGRVSVQHDGTTIFQGKCYADHVLASPGSPGRTLTFEDAWKDLELLVFQQQWAYKPAGTPLASALFSRVNLFQNYAGGGLLTVGQQVAAIISYAQSCGVAIQAGTCDIPWYLPIYPVKAISCAEAILICLRTCPDAATWIDYTTTPPTFHCRQRASLASLSLPYATDTHESSDITPRYDLQSSHIVLQYQKTNNDNGKQFTLFATSVYPPGTTGQEIGAMVIPVDLRGGERRDLQVLVKSITMDPTSLAWWQLKKPELANVNLQNLAFATSGGSPIAPTVVDDYGNPVSLAAFPYEHKGGEVQSWMTSGGTSIQAKMVTITAWFTYDEVDVKNRKIHSVGNNNPHQVSTRIRVTNSVPGDVVYSTLQHYDPGESAPAGLEQYLYNTLSVLTFDGTHTMRETDTDGSPTVTRIIGPWNKLNLTGGAAAWATMAAAVQEVEHNFMRGQTVINFGPPKHLAPGELAQLLQLWRFRAVYDAPSLRISGEDSEASGQVGGDTAAENTTAANAPMSFHAVGDTATGGVTLIQADATNQLWEMKVLDDTKAVVASAGQVKIDLPTIAGEVAQWRQVCVLVSGVQKTAWALMTEPK